MVLRMDLDLPGTDTAAVRVSLPRKHRPELRDVGRRGVILDPLLQLRNAAGLGSEQMRNAGKDLCYFATGDVTMFAQFEESALDAKCGAAMSTVRCL